MFQHFLDQIILDNTILRYLIVAGMILFTLLFKQFFSRYVAGLIARLIGRKHKAFDIKRFRNLVVSPIETFLMILIILIALGTLKYPELLNFNIYKTNFAVILDGISNVAIIISFIWLCTRLIDYIAELMHEKALLTQDRTDDQLIIFFKDFFKVILRIVGLLLIIRFGFGKSIGNMLTGLSIVGAAMALAFRESLENLIASFIIFFDKPFTIGDVVKVLAVTGTVESIGLRSTRIRTTDKTYVTVPNKQMVDTVLDNQSLRTQRKVETTFQLGLSTPVQKITAFLSQANIILQQEHVEDSTVFLSDTGQQSHVISIEYYTSVEQPIKDFQLMRQTINLGLVAALEQLGIDLAADKTDIVIHRAAAK
ncbi:MAG: mechanosensitive ion channel domain-containing protein [Chitinophagaceae bacterium]